VFHQFLPVFDCYDHFDQLVLGRRSLHADGESEGEMDAAAAAAAAAGGGRISIVDRRLRPQPVATDARGRR
jgi:hypothetical protein